VIKVFVQLAHGTDAHDWPARLEAGAVIGINERSPYGYHLAEQWGCDVRFSRSAGESALTGLARRGLRRLLGFDAIHAARNWRAMRDCDVVWTHTECQTLSVLLLRRWHRGARSPRVIGQSIWLFDDWHRLHWPLRRLYGWLLGGADVLTVHSPLNLAVLRAALPRAHAELVRFGIGSATPLPERGPRGPGAPVRLIAVGNDRDRDWATLLAAIAGDAGFALTIVSTRLRPDAVAANVRVVRPQDNAALFALYAAADIAVVPLKPNLHASGCTAIQEATLLGLPVVCSRTGGLDAYFEETHVHYTPASDAAALAAALRSLAARPEDWPRQAARARERIDEQLGVRHFVRRHVELTRTALAGPGPR
jgi:glycosyltransferase involved in cell wall biosynthesis